VFKAKLKMPQKRQVSEIKLSNFVPSWQKERCHEDAKIQRKEYFVPSWLTLTCQNKQAFFYSIR
jgi:hypothetical protein